MSYIKVYIHLVFGTKNRYPYLNNKLIREKLWNHIKENAKFKGIYIDFINGYKDHCHCLVSLGVNQTIKDIAQLIKGESSFWFNKEKLHSSKFKWQEEYFAAPVSESMIASTRKYIKNQEEHHKKKSFKDEYNEFLLKHGFEKCIDSFG